LNIQHTKQQNKTATLCLTLCFVWFCLHVMGINGPFFFITLHLFLIAIMPSLSPEQRVQVAATCTNWTPTRTWIASPPTQRASITGPTATKWSSWARTIARRASSRSPEFWLVSKWYDLSYQISLIRHVRLVLCGASTNITHTTCMTYIQSLLKHHFLFQLSLAVPSLACSAPYSWSCSSCTAWGKRTRDPMRWTSQRDRRPTIRMRKMRITASSTPEIMARRAGIKLTTSAGTKCKDGTVCVWLDEGGATGFGLAQLNTLCGVVGVQHHRQTTETRINHPQQQLQN